MPTRADIQAKLAAIDQRKADALKALQAQRVKLKAKLAQLDRPSKSQRRLDARRKILVGAFILEKMQRSAISPQALCFEGQRFFEWLLRENDRAVFEGLNFEAPGRALTETALEVPFADKDQVKALGASWHPDQKRWVVPAGLALAPFQRWLPARQV